MISVDKCFSGLVLACALWQSMLGAADADWTPEKTRVFIVGVLEWKDSETFGSFPKKGRRDTRLLNFFKKRGVKDANIVALQDAAATSKAVRSAFDEFLAESDKGETLFVYYCGHGYEIADGTVCFATYDARGSKARNTWSIPSIFNAIEKNFSGSRVILMADCCQSGALVDAAKKHQSKIQYACFAPSPATETSTGCWTFSDSLLDAFEGAPHVDRNGDGAISYNETARYIAAQMAYFDDQTATTCAINGFKTEWRLALAQNGKTHSRIGQHVEVKRDDDWEKTLITDFKEGEFKVRFAATAERRELWVAEKDIRSKQDDPTAAVPRPAPAYAVGMSVKVEWESRWWPAKILKVNAEKDKFYVIYEGYDTEWNEWVPPERLRRRRN